MAASVPLLILMVATQIFGQSINLILDKEQYLKNINISEFDCLKNCAGQLGEEPADDDPVDQRKIITSCERDVFPSCKTSASLVQIHESKYFFNAPQKVTWAQALQQCRKQNLQLITIDSEALAIKISSHLTSKGMASGAFWSSGITLSSAEDGQVWLETGLPVVSSLVGKRTPGTALSFIVNGKTLRWTEDATSKTNSLACEVPEECFTTRCIAA